MSRSRNFVFTLNNYGPTDLNDILFRLVDPKYVVIGHETGENGTPHLQGFVCFENARSFKQLKALLPRAHIEIKSAYSTFKQASDYCKKEGHFHEQGELPKDPSSKGDDEKVRWAAIIQLAEDGDWETLKEAHPVEYASKLKMLEYIHTKRPRELVECDVPHQWIYGPPGTGKSRKARDENPGFYIKDPTEKWWDGYDGEDVVIIDDFDKFQIKQGGDMKRWLDRYPFQAQVKGGYQKIRPTKIVVTSNYHPSEIWDDELTVKAILRRVELIHLVLPWKPPSPPQVPVDVLRVPNLAEVPPPQVPVDVLGVPPVQGNRAPQVLSPAPQVLSQAPQVPVDDYWELQSDIEEFLAEEDLLREAANAHNERSGSVASPPAAHARGSAPSPI